MQAPCEPTMGSADLPQRGPRLPVPWWTPAVSSGDNLRQSCGSSSQRSLSLLHQGQAGPLGVKQEVQALLEVWVLPLLPPPHPAFSQTEPRTHSHRGCQRLRAVDFQVFFSILTP